MIIEMIIIMIVSIVIIMFIIMITQDASTPLCGSAQVVEMITINIITMID